MFHHTKSMLMLIGTMMLCLFAFTAFSQSDFQNRFKWDEIAELPPAAGMEFQQGIASPFAGCIEETVIVAGGCNFPDEPVHEGGKKKYYDDVFILKTNNGSYEWGSGFKLPYEVAYGASVSLEEGLLCIGGKNNRSSLRSVLLLKWNPATSKIEIEEWPTLPFGMSQMGAAKIDDKIYIAGGISDGKLINSFLSLDLSKKGTDEFRWQILDNYPGPTRLQPVVVAQNAAEENCLYLISGSSYPETQTEPDITTDGLEFNPKTGKWKPMAEISPNGLPPFSLHGAGGIAIGTNHILFIGGVNREIFYNAWKKEWEGKIATESGDSIAIIGYNKWRQEYFTHPPDWFRFNSKVLVYHTITNSWAIADDYPFPAPAGAPVIEFEDGWLVISGEVMPGVRSPKVYFGELNADPVFGWLNWLILFVYLGGMLYLGFFFLKREQSTGNFFKGGGRIPWWAAGMSIFATMLSAITFMAIPAKTFATDWRYYPMAITILIMAFPVVKYYLPFFRRLNVTTAYEYLEARFNYATRFLASFLFIFFMVARMALVLFLPSLALTTVTGIDIYICIVLMGVITIVYCTMGGVEAVIWGDVIQGFVLLGGALLAVVFLVAGTEGGISQVIEISIDNDKLKIFDFSFVFTSATFWVIILGGLANNLISYSADQTVIQRYLTTKDEKSAAKGIIMNGVLSVFVSIVFYFIGTALYAYYKTQPQELNFVMENTDSIFPHFIMTKMPVGVAGLLIAAIFAATMSTVSSNVNSLSTAFTADFFNHFFPNKDDRMQLKVARLSGIVLGGAGVIFALLMASSNILSLFDFFNYILGLLASGLGGLFIMGIFFPRIDGRSALLGFVTGTAFLFYIQSQTDISFLLYGFIGIVATVTLALFFSLFPADKSRQNKGLTWKEIKRKKH